ncbi:MAG: EamA family transporter [Thermoleophilia bacterium]|nr:EamA family transporter [Thermoleophilia bacterium]
MTRAYWPLLGLLALIWGASYLFIKVAVDDVEPAAMMFFRLAVAGLLLLPLVLARGQLWEMRRAWRAGLVLGIANAAVPFTLIAWGEQYVDSGVAAIANATVPLFVALLLIRFLPSERLSRSRLAGVLLGLVGVAVLTGGQPAAGGWWAVAGTLAVVVASFAYAIGGVYGQVRVQGTSGPVLATASMLAGALVLLPLAAFQVPDELPSREALGSLLALTVLGTAFAQLILFRMLRLHGSARLSLVTYLMPPVALFYGALLLDEPVRTEAVAGLALILAGVAVGSGKMRRRPQRA